MSTPTSSAARVLRLGAGAVLAFSFGRLSLVVGASALDVARSLGGVTLALWPSALVLASSATLAAYGAALAVSAARGVAPPRAFLPIGFAICSGLAVAVHVSGGVARLIDGTEDIPIVLPSVVALALALAVHVVVHEAGHLLAARLVGSRFQAVRFGPLVVRREGPRVKVGLNRFHLAGMGGFALAIPRGGPGFVRDFAITVAGGPLASIAFTVALWLAARAVSPPETDAELVTSFLLWHAAAAGAFVSVMNAVPRRTRSGVRTDGELLRLALGARTDAARAFLAFLLDAKLGRRPREWAASASDLVTAMDADPRHAPEVRVAALGAALDRGETALAERLLSRGPGKVGARDPVRHEFALQGSLAAALVHGDAQAARARLAEAGPTALRDYSLLAEAGVAAAEGRLDDARGLLARWQDAVTRSGIPAIRIGNEWAEDRLIALLDAPRSHVA